MKKLLKKTAAVQLEKQALQYCSLKPVQQRILSVGMNHERAALILTNATKWVNGTNLHYYFFDKKTDGAFVKKGNGSKVWKTYVGDKAQMDVVRNAFKIWKSIGIGLTFTEVTSREEAEIRIGFMEDDGSWSYIGREVLQQPLNARTMNFGWNIATPDKHNGIDTAIHEIGHSLGFPHEHQNPFSGIVWDEEAVYKSLAAPPNNWDRETTFDNIIKKLPTNEVNGSTWDPNSIMHYPFEAGLIKKPTKYTHGLFPAGGLSKNDIKWAKHFYPATNKAATKVAETMTSYEIHVGNTEQQDFQFAPTETKNYNIQTFGNVDTVIVVFEDKGKNNLQYISGDDSSGQGKSSAIKTKLFRGKTYIIKVRVYYKSPQEKAALMIW